jgi:hypothetical protein
MDTRFPTYRNSQIWKPDDLSVKVRENVIYLPELIEGALERAARVPIVGERLSQGIRGKLPHTVDTSKLYSGVKATILDDLFAVKSTNLRIPNTRTEDLQSGLLIALSKASSIYDNKHFEDFVTGLCPEKTEFWMSYAQMVQVGFELMKLSTRTQPLDLQDFYAEHVEELRTELSKGRAFHPEESREFLNLAGEKPKFENANFEDLVHSSSYHRFPFRKFLSRVIMSTMYHLEKQGKLACYGRLNKPQKGPKGQPRGDPNFNLVCIPSKFINE